MIDFLTIFISCLAGATLALPGEEASLPRGYSIPLIDLAGETHRQVVVDREPGQYLGHPTTVLLEDNYVKTDCAYPGLELLDDGTFVTTTYGHWIKGESPFIVSVRFKMEEIDDRARIVN